MVARQIREDGRSKAAAPETIESERMRTAFQNRMRAARPNDFGKEALQVERFGRGGFRGISFEWGAVFDRAEEPTAQTGGVNDGVQKKARGGLAVCSGDSDEL